MVKMLIVSFVTIVIHQIVITFHTCLKDITRFVCVTVTEPGLAIVLEVGLTKF